MPKRYFFEGMGYHAFAKGIKNAHDDPDFVANINNADPREYEMSPQEDWDQGWLIAAYKNKQDNS